MAKISFQVSAPEYALTSTEKENSHRIGVGVGGQISQELLTIQKNDTVLGVMVGGEVGYAIAPESHAKKEVTTVASAGLELPDEVEALQSETAPSYFFKDGSVAAPQSTSTNNDWPSSSRSHGFQGKIKAGLTLAGEKIKLTVGPEFRLFSALSGKTLAPGRYGFEDLKRDQALGGFADLNIQASEKVTISAGIFAGVGRRFSQDGRMKTAQRAVTTGVGLGVTLDLATIFDGLIKDEPLFSLTPPTTKQPEPEKKSDPFKNPEDIEDIIPEVVVTKDQAQETAQMEFWARLGESQHIYLENMNAIEDFIEKDKQAGIEALETLYKIAILSANADEGAQYENQIANKKYEYQLAMKQMMAYIEEDGEKPKFSPSLQDELTQISQPVNNTPPPSDATAAGKPSADGDIEIVTTKDQVIIVNDGLVKAATDANTGVVAVLAAGDPTATTTAPVSTTPVPVSVALTPDTPVDQVIKKIFVESADTIKAVEMGIAGANSAIENDENKITGHQSNAASEIAGIQAFIEKAAKLSDDNIAQSHPDELALALFLYDDFTPDQIETPPSASAVPVAFQPITNTLDNKITEVQMIFLIDGSGSFRSQLGAVKPTITQALLDFKKNNNPNINMKLDFYLYGDGTQKKVTSLNLTLQDVSQEKIEAQTDAVLNEMKSFYGDSETAWHTVRNLLKNSAKLQEHQAQHIFIVSDVEVNHAANETPFNNLNNKFTRKNAEKLVADKGAKLTVINLNEENAKPSQAMPKWQSYNYNPATDQPQPPEETNDGHPIGCNCHICSGLEQLPPPPPL